MNQEKSKAGRKKRAPVVVAPTLVKQSNMLTMASYELSVAAKNVLTICLAEMTAHDAKMGAAFIDHQLYKKHFPSSHSRVAADLTAGVKELGTALLRFKSPDPNFESRYVNWFEHIDTIGEGTNNVAYGLLFHSAVMPHLEALEKEFTWYHVGECAPLKSFNQKRLYECLCQFRGKSGVGFWKVSPREFIHGGIFKFGVSLQKNAAKMKQSFLSLALDAINVNTPLFVTFSEDGEDGKPDGYFHFTIYSGKAAENAKARAKLAAINAGLAAAQLPLATDDAKAEALTGEAEEGAA